MCGQFPVHFIFQFALALQICQNPKAMTDSTDNSAVREFELEKNGWHPGTKMAECAYKHKVSS